MARVVLDASALLAMLREEPGGERVARLLIEIDEPVWISAVNWSEVCDRLLRMGTPDEVVSRVLNRLWVEIVPFDAEQGREAARLHAAAPALSLGDRACLALARMQKAAAWTADKVWERFELGVKVELLR